MDNGLWTMVSKKCVLIMSVTQKKKVNSGQIVFTQRRRKMKMEEKKVLHVHCLHPIDNFAISDW